MAKNRGGRPEKYETHVKPYLELIKNQVADGATEEQIAKNLRVAYSTFSVYKLKYPELKEALKNKGPLVEKLRGALVKKALGFTYKEKKEYVREDPATGEKVKYIEIQTRESLPDTTAIFGALNLYDPDYVKDKKSHELKEKDYELRKQIAEANNFDLDLK